MAFDFPASPSVGQTFTPSGGPSYTWNGYAWDVATAALGSVPDAPAGGQLYLRQNGSWVASGAFTTGDAKLTLKNIADAGWVLANDGTIGDATSGGTTRANVDCLALFTLLFTNITDTWAPIYLQSSGTLSSRAAFSNNATTAFNAHAHISVPKQLGRSLLVAGAGVGLSARALGQTLGAEVHSQTGAEMAAHAHSTSDAGHAHGGNIGGLWPNTSGSSFQVQLGSGPAAAEYAGNNFSGTTTNATGVAIVSNGSSSPMDIMNPSAAWNIMIKL